MSESLLIHGVIRNVSYKTMLQSPLIHYPLSDFNINQVRGYGVIDVSDNYKLGYSQWISPKRTRSYPFARLYNTYNLAKRVTIIPIMKDEGVNGDQDFISFITLSWMNLANVYIILAYYDDAIAHPKKTGKITKQRLDSNYIHDKLNEIIDYQQTALHWNIMHFERDFEATYKKALDRYQYIAQKTGVLLHPQEPQLKKLESYNHNGAFHLETFKQISLGRSQSAAQREQHTTHALERLDDGEKALFSITNWLGGEYHLTADEVFFEGDTLIIQEAKNSKDLFPSLSDIQDGLFKLILFSNMQEVSINDKSVSFKTRLKITGNFHGKLHLPTSPETLQEFSQQNKLSKEKKQLLERLNDEAITNPPLSIMFQGNNP
jgi:hypothetical protein